MKERKKEKGFYILPSELFVTVRTKARHDANLNETLAAVFRNIESSAKGSDSEDDLCRINMFLHDINYNHFDIVHGDTLTDPKHWDDEPFDAIVSNPPYSTKWEGKDNPVLINDPRFSPVKTEPKYWKRLSSAKTSIILPNWSIIRPLGKTTTTSRSPPMWRKRTPGR